MPHRTPRNTSKALDPQQLRLQSHGEDFAAAVEKLEQAYREGLHAFTQWVAEAWQLDTAEQWRASTAEPYPGEDYRAGWNAAMASLEGALELFLEEHGY